MENRNAVMFIGTNRAHVAAMQVAAEMGLRTVATDRSPDVPGAAVADVFEALDGGDIDGIVSLAQRVHKETPIKAAHGVADFAFAAVGAVHESLGLTGLSSREVYGRMTDKARSRTCWQEAGLPVAAGTTYLPNGDRESALPRILREVGLPAIVKPLTGHGGLGVTRVDEGGESELAELLANAPDAGMVIEAELQGRHFNVDGIMIDGALRPVIVTERTFGDAGSYQCRRSIHPADLDEAVRDNLFDLARRAAGALGYRAGPLTVDMVLTGDGPVLLEASPHFHNLRATMDLDGGRSLRVWFSHLLGQPFDDRNDLQAAFCSGACRVFPPCSGRVERIVGLQSAESLEGVVEISVRRRPGEMVRTVRGRRDLGAIVWVQAPDHRTLDRTMCEVEKTLSFEIAGSNR